MTTVSVLLANYNHGHHISQAIEAVVAQSRLPDEFIIMDDGSTDDSVDTISRFVERYPFIRLVRNNKNIGAVAAYRQLLEMATGKYLFCCAADDWVLPEFIARSMELLERHPQSALCSGLSFVCNEEGQRTRIFPTPIVSRKPSYINPAEVRRKLLQYGGWFMGNTTIYRRQTLLDEGGFRPDLGPFIDGFACHVLALRHGACFIPEPHAIWRRLDTGFSASSSLDTEKTRNMIELAKFLMLECPAYAGLFPERYVRAWEKRQGYWTGMATERRNAQQLANSLNRRLDVKGQPPPLRAGIILVTKMILGGRSLFTRIYLLCRSMTWPSSLFMLHWLLRNLAHRLADVGRRYR